MASVLVKILVAQVGDDGQMEGRWAGEDAGRRQQARQGVPLQPTRLAGTVPAYTNYFLQCCRSALVSMRIRIRIRIKRFWSMRIRIRIPNADPDPPSWPKWMRIRADPQHWLCGEQIRHMKFASEFFPCVTASGFFFFLNMSCLFAVLRIRIRMFLGLPDPLVTVRIRIRLFIKQK